MTLSKNPGRLPFVNILEFESMEEMSRTIEYLVGLDASGKEFWYGQKNGFVSQAMMQRKAVEELSLAETIEEVRDIQARYAPMFLFNSNEEDEDISPYIPSDIEGGYLVCNPQGEVMIGGQVVNLNNLESYEQTKFYKYSQETGTRTWTESTNYLYCQSANNKFWAEAKRTSDAIWVEFTAQHRTLFGWNWSWAKYYASLAKAATTTTNRPDINMWLYPDVVFQGPLEEHLRSGGYIWNPNLNRWQNKDLGNYMELGNFNVHHDYLIGFTSPFHSNYKTEFMMHTDYPGVGYENAGMLRISF